MTLEDQVRSGPKVPGETCIPTGVYQILLTASPKFKQVLPLLIDVPGFDGIRIHPGNTDKDTDGCLLVGESVVMQLGVPFLLHSRSAFDRLMPKLEDAIKRGERIEIEVSP